MQKTTDVETGEITTALAIPDSSEIVLTGDDLVLLSGQILERGLAQLEIENDLNALKESRDKVTALESYFAGQLHELHARRRAGNNLAELRIHQERKLGTVIKEMQERGELRTQSDGKSKAFHDETPTPSLGDYSITRLQYHRWQMEASYPDDMLEKFIAERTESDEGELTSGELYMRAKRMRKKVRDPKDELPTDTYRVIYADPPWEYGNTMPEGFREQVDHYTLMSIEELCELPVKDMAEDDSVLFMWVTSPILAEAFAVIEAWGFIYKASFVWDKVKHVMGHYNSVRHEFLLICTRGSCPPDVKKLFDSVVVEERTEHSRKPDVFRQMIDTLYPNGKRIELFARRPADDHWETWGNEL